MKAICLVPTMGGALLFASLLISPGTSGNPENTDKVLQDLDDAWGRAVVNHDWKALEHILADEFIAVGDQGQILNKSQDIEQLRKSQQSQPTYEAGEYVVLMLDPAAAVMVHRATSTSVTDGRQSSETHRSLHVFVKRGGRWQVVATAQTPIP